MKITTYDAKESQKSSFKFSIIVPAFNAQDFIHRCITSCLSQSYINLEIIVIDDASTDDTLKILENFKDQIILFKNPINKGAFFSRILGCKHAQGDYVLFLDADDFLSLDACATLAKTLSQNPYDITHYKISYDNHSKHSKLSNFLHLLRFFLPENHKKDTKLLSNDSILKHFFLSSYHFPKMTLWDKCYSQKIIQKAILYQSASETPLIFAEDVFFFFLLAKEATSYQSIQQKLYHYCLNPNSTTQHRSHEKSLQKIASLQSIFQELQTIQTQTKLQSKVLKRLQNIIQSQIILECRFKPKSYLSSCFKSLKYWNRLLTYARIFIFLCSFGRIKI